MWVSWVMSLGGTEAQVLLVDICLRYNTSESRSDSAGPAELVNPFYFLFPLPSEILLSDSKDLELQMVMSHGMGAGRRVWVISALVGGV